MILWFCFVILSVSGVNNELVAAQPMYHKTSKAKNVSAAFHESLKETNYNTVVRELVDNITTELQHCEIFWYVCWSATRPCCGSNCGSENIWGVFHQPHDRTKSKLFYYNFILFHDIMNSDYQSNSVIDEHPPTVATVDDVDPIRLLYRIFMSKINIISVRVPNITDQIQFINTWKTEVAFKGDHHQTRKVTMICRHHNVTDYVMKDGFWC